MSEATLNHILNILHTDWTSILYIQLIALYVHKINLKV